MTLKDEDESKIIFKGLKLEEGIQFEILMPLCCPQRFVEAVAFLQEATHRYKNFPLAVSPGSRLLHML
jgi:hypothetical protein